VKKGKKDLSENQVEIEKFKKEVERLESQLKETTKDLDLLS